jgi:hypothetical protein
VSKAATPAKAARRSAKARLAYQLGARKMYRDRPAKLLCVAVIVLRFRPRV